eukprot:CAMPEP_0175056632 /NCGR_PEP_ID=MMETSP0052_2-20121109/10788_1 /TAXON_ID=51329 ORGANISM="Polytomella parva, Strain SAG 63-3" /NCGR_SAMPLE_ID=MMETSP0052_2 /ASSEMBLY_ACC=CAM_ASM_000194 /LENGTH=292 /DNA_ID=CAMNT_0016321699 /DNA_START=84 /DNA_END=959 /DNA_ORIENTATION=-
MVELSDNIITLRNDKGYIIKVSKYAAHILSWTDPNGKEILFMSKKAIFTPPKAIRGGVPICFPQFGSLGPLKTAHGFVRNSSSWVVESLSPSSTTLKLSYNGEDTSYPFPFELRSTVTLSSAGELEQTLQVRHVGLPSSTTSSKEAMPFTGALHTYYSINDISAVRVLGLGNVPYEDNLKGRALVDSAASDAKDPIVIDKEVDRIYKLDPNALCKAANKYNNSASFEIQDRGNNRVIKIQIQGFPDAVLWNPWIEKSKALADFEDLEYQNMVCLEPAVAGSGPFKLDPGATW